MEETILIQGICNRVKGAFVENGHGMLTNKRFIYSKHSLAKIAVMGVLVNLTKGDFDFDIKISDIVEVSERKRVFQRILIIATSGGEKYEFYFSKIEEWKIHFDNLLNQSLGEKTQLVNSVADELKKFKDLLDSGVITQEEFDTQKEKLFRS